MKTGPGGGNDAAGGRGLRVQPAYRAVVDHLQVDLVSHQLSDVVDAVFDHGGSAGQRRRAK